MSESTDEILNVHKVLDLSRNLAQAHLKYDSPGVTSSIPVLLCLNKAITEHLRDRKLYYKAQKPLLEYMTPYLLDSMSIKGL